MSAIRGAVAAMAMTGMRAVTKDLGLVRATPPEETFPVRRRALVEVGHWAFGATAGAAYAALPERARRPRWSGPAYGLAIWAGFQAVAPLTPRPEAERTVTERLAIAADHVLYGLILDPP